MPPQNFENVRNARVLVIGRRSFDIGRRKVAGLLRTYTRPFPFSFAGSAAGKIALRHQVTVSRTEMFLGAANHYRTALHVQRC